MKLRTGKEILLDMQEWPCGTDAEKELCVRKLMERYTSASHPESWLRFIETTIRTGFEYGDALFAVTPVESLLVMSAKEEEEPDEEFRVFLAIKLCVWFTVMCDVVGMKESLLDTYRRALEALKEDGR